MHVLILGGSPHHLGGVEAFCERAELALLARDPHIRTARIATGTAFLSLGRLPTFLAGLAKLVAYRQRRPDVVWLQYVNFPDLAYLVVARLLGHRVMVTPHLGVNWRSQKSVVLRTLSKRLLGFAARLALISRTQELEIALPDKVERSLIRNFLPRRLLTGQPPNEVGNNPILELVHSGRLSAGKGTFLVIEACGHLKRLQRPFRARITGAADSNTLSAMQAMIARLDVKDEVQILGRISDDELLEVLSTSDVLMHLSRIDSYPLIVLESLACSVFPICLELPGARDMVQTYDGFMASDDDHTVQETIAFLQQHEVGALRRRAGAAAKAVRTDYDWTVCADALGQALASVSERSYRS